MKMSKMLIIVVPVSVIFYLVLPFIVKLLKIGILVNLSSLSSYGDYVGGAGTILSLATIIFLIYESNQKEKEHQNDLEIERKKHDELIKKYDGLIEEYRKSVDIQREDLKFSKMTAEFSNLSSLETSSKDTYSKLNNNALGHLLKIEQSRLLKLYVKKITPKYTIKKIPYGPIIFNTPSIQNQPSSTLDISNPANLHVKIESIDCPENNIITDTKLTKIYFNKEGLEDLNEGSFFVVTVVFSADELIGCKFTQHIKYTKIAEDISDSRGNSSKNWTVDDSKGVEVGYFGE